jgi:hypothetical protein
MASQIFLATDAVVRASRIHEHRFTRINQETRKLGMEPKNFVRCAFLVSPGFLVSRLCRARRTKTPCVPALKLSRYPRFFAAILAALPSISEIPFLDS